MSFLKMTGFLSQAISRLTMQPPRPLLNSVLVRTFKDKDVLRLRCSDCYFKKIDQRWWVLCNTHRRHKQREIIEDIRKKWIVTHLTFGGRPFQKKEEAYICNLAPPGPFDYGVKLLKKELEDVGTHKRIKRILPDGAKYVKLV